MNKQCTWILLLLLTVLSVALSGCQEKEQADTAAVSEAEILEAEAVGDDVDPTWLPSAPTPSMSPAEIPLSNEALFIYLTSQAYRSFANQEMETHRTTGPHTQFGLPVRVFYNDTIAAAIKADAATYPTGSGIVKEMYDESEALAGWAVMVKTQDNSDNGKGWFWYEVTSATDGTKLQASGNGVPGCFGCHIGGKDMVLSRTDEIK